MSSFSSPSRDCYSGFETPQPTQRRKRTYGSATNLYSHKRRRLYSISHEQDVEEDLSDTTTPGKSRGTPIDRFIPSRPKMSLPLEITPRTKRISKQLGLVDDRLLNFKGERDDITNSNAEGTYNLVRANASSLQKPVIPLRTSSVVENLTKKRQCLLTLDSPGLTRSPDAFPISWSSHNLIAVACHKDVFYQNLDTRLVYRLFRLTERGGVNAIGWGEKDRANQLAAGVDTGIIQLWDAGHAGLPIRMWRDVANHSVKCLSWREDVLAAGAEDGVISLFDVRSANSWKRVEQHRASVLNLSWSSDGNFLASSDYDGIVHIWDKRACKSLLELGKRSVKIRHSAPIKALAWCKWKPDLLATGSSYPEGKIRIWSTSSASSSCPTPTETFPMNTSVLSLQWSPHCRELLSTHGSSFEPPLTRRKSTSVLQTSQRTSRQMNNAVKLVSSPLTNSIAVHEYPSGRRLLALSNAHIGAVTHSCLSPNGENVFTASPTEETIKMWQVWSKQPDIARDDCAFDKFSIR